MMIYAQIVSQWTGDGTPKIDPKRPRFTNDYPAIRADDITGQVSAPPPGVLVIGATMTQAEYDIISADNRYNVLSANEVSNG